MIQIIQRVLSSSSLNFIFQQILMNSSYDMKKSYAKRFVCFLMNNSDAPACAHAHRTNYGASKSLCTPHNLSALCHIRLKNLFFLTIYISNFLYILNILLRLRFGWGSGAIADCTHLNEWKSLLWRLTVSWICVNLCWQIPKSCRKPEYGVVEAVSATYKIVECNIYQAYMHMVLTY